MSDSAKSINDFPVEASIPDSTVSLESILCTNELRRRQSRPPDYEKENHALVALLSALLDSPAKILQTLAETILDVTQCDSSGVSLLTKDGKRFYWPAIAGMWKPHIGGGTPRDFGPWRRRARSQLYIVVQTLRAALPLFSTGNTSDRRVPAGSVLRRRQSSRDDMGDHSQ